MRSAWSLDKLIEQLARAEDPDGVIAEVLRGVDLGVARREVLARLRASSADPLRTDLLCRVLAAIQPGEVVEEIMDLLVAEGISDERRLSLLSALARAPLPRVAAVVAGDARREDVLLRATIYAAVRAVHDTPSAAEQVLAMLHAAGPAMRLEHLREIESVRARVAVSPTILYAPMLRDAALIVDERARGIMLDALVAEASTAGSELLQALRTGASKKLRAPFQIALLKLETARISGVSATGALRCWCTQPDGQGAVVALAAFANPDGSSTLVDLCFRLGRDLRQGFVVPQVQEREVVETLRELSSGDLELAPVPPAELGTLIAEALASHARMGVKTPDECVAPAHAMQRLPRARLPALAAAPAVSVRRVEEILSTPRHSAWFFDDDDLRRVAPKSADLPGRFPLEAIGASPLRARLEAMAEYMVHWTRWKGEPDLSAEWRGIARELTQDFGRSALLYAMCGASTEILKSAQDGGDDYGKAGILFTFRELYPELAGRELRTLTFVNHRKIPDGEYLLDELYCTAKSCDCDRVLFAVIDPRTGRTLCRIGHAFSPDAARRFFTRQTVLEPLSSAPRWADAMVREIHDAATGEGPWRATLRRHYELARAL